MLRNPGSFICYHTLMLPQPVIVSCYAWPNIISLPDYDEMNRGMFRTLSHSPFRVPDTCAMFCLGADPEPSFQNIGGCGRDHNRSKLEVEKYEYGDYLRELQAQGMS